MDDIMDTEDLLTVREAAIKIGVSESAVRNATLEGRLVFVRKFGRKLISRDALAEYQERTQPNGVKPLGRPQRRDDMGAVLPPEDQGGI